MDCEYNPEVAERSPVISVSIQSFMKAIKEEDLETTDHIFSIIGREIIRSIYGGGRRRAIICGIRDPTVMYIFVNRYWKPDPLDVVRALKPLYDEIERRFDNYAIIDMVMASLDSKTRENLYDAAYVEYPNNSGFRHMILSISEVSNHVDDV